MNQFAMHIGFDAHHRKPLSCRAGEQAQIGIEDIEGQNAAGSQVAVDSSEQRREFGRLAQMQQRVPRDENQRETLAKIEVSHVTLDEVDRRARGNGTTPRSGQHGR